MRQEHYEFSNSYNKIKGVPLIDQAEAKKIHITVLLQDSLEFATLLLNKQWILVKNNTNILFLTSDNPCVRSNVLEDNIGIDISGFQLYTPLKPDLLLLMTNPIQHGPNLGSMFDAPVAFVDHANSLQIIQSQSRLYSQNNDFTFAQNLIRQRPELKNPERPRVNLLQK
jgi:hypothetical protein